MSRKRKQSKRAAVKPVSTEAVPEEVLAEGSGPVERVDARELAEAANAVGRRRKKRRGPERVAEASTESEASGQSDEVSAGGEDETSNGAAAAVEPELEAMEAMEAAAEAAEGELSVETAAEGEELVAEATGEGEELVAEATGEGEELVTEAVEDEELVAAAAETEGGEAACVEEVSAASDGEAGETGAVDAEQAAAEGEGLEAAGEEEAGELGAVLPTSAASMDAAQIKHLVEALVFATDKPLTIARLRQLTRVSDTKRLEQALAEITEDFRERGLVLQQVSGGYQFRTATRYSAWVQQLIAGRPVRLSRAQLETLAIIAYRQPITRPEIDEIRGVDSSATLKLLIDRALIRILGKKEEVGRPMLYGTTKEFLDFFSLGDLRELPTLREYSELTDESRQVMSARLGIELDETARATEGSQAAASEPGDGDDDGGGGDDSGGEGGGGGGGGGGFEPGGFEPSDLGPDGADSDAVVAASEEVESRVGAAADEAMATATVDAEPAAEAAADEAMADEAMAAAAESPVGAAADEAMAAEVESPVGAAADEAMADEAMAAEAESPVGAAADAGVAAVEAEADEGFSAADAESEQAVVEDGAEWPEGSGRVQGAEADEPVFVMPDVEDVDEVRAEDGGAGGMDPVLVAEQVEAASLESTPE